MRQRRGLIAIAQEAVEAAQAQYIDRIVDVPVVLQRQVPINTTAQKTVEVPQIQFLDQAVGALVSVQQTTKIQNVKKMVESTQVQLVH